MSDQSSEYESGEYESTEGQGGEGGDWIEGSEIQAEGSGLQMFSGTIDVDTSGLPEPTDEDNEDDNVA